jgi:protease I
MKHALIVIAREGYQDIELTGTRKGLEEAGFGITLASTEAGECTGKLGGKETAEIALRDVVVTHYDRIAFIGGPGAHALAKDFDALNVARTAADAAMIIGAICIAPTILAAAGILRGKHATVHDKTGEQERILTEAGAIYTGAPVTVDGKLVTANGPDAAEEFGKTLAALTD